MSIYDNENDGSIYSSKSLSSRSNKSPKSELRYDTKGLTKSKGWQDYMLSGP